MSGGAGTFLMERMPKSTQRVGVFRNFGKVPMVLFCHIKEEGVPQAIFIMLKFVSNIRYTVKKSMKQNKKMVKIC